VCIFQVSFKSSKRLSVNIQSKVDGLQ